MKKIAFQKCIVLVFLLVVSFLTHAQQVFKTTKSGTIIGFLEYVPSDYNSNSNKYPVVIFLHGLDERGATSTDPAVLQTTIDLVTKQGPPMHVKKGVQFPFILISPQLKKSYSSWPSAYVQEVIDYVKTYLRVDERRIHVTGLSLGGYGTWTCIENLPQLFASGAPVCGGNNNPSKACGIASENVGVWGFHGDADGVVSYTKTTNMISAINSCSPAPNPLAKASIYAGISHNAWTRAYTLDHTYHNPNLYEWWMSTTKTKKGGNTIPVANAGSDKSISGSSTTIAGSGTDSNGSIASYSWTQSQGPSTASLSGSSSANLSVSGLITGKYVFKLQVTDNGGATDSDYVSVTVSSGNASPVAAAGADQVITLPTNTATFSGTGTDSNGTIASYSWTKVSGGTATLSGNTTANLSVSNLVAGAYVFRLTVTDNQGATGTDDVALTVNVAPTVSAGVDKSITLPTNSVSIQGTASDTDGTIASYAWTKIAGSTATLSGATSANLTASALVQGSYTFRLTVTDNLGASKYDDVVVNVLASSTNPVANAGADKVVHLPTNSTTINGSATDDGTITSYAWTKVSGGAATLSGASTSTLTATGLVAGVYVFRLTVTDNSGKTGSDDVTITVNNPPSVSVGADKQITLPTNSVSLQGVASDTDGSIATYAWTKVSGGTATFTGSTSANATISGLVEGAYVFRLTVQDNLGATKSDDVTVNVLSSSTNTPPSVSVGKDFNITLPTNSLTVQGIVSDADGTIASYQWKMTTGTVGTLSGVNTSKLTATNLVEGKYVFRLIVKDDDGATSFDDVLVFVLPNPTTNAAPQANAGADKVISLPTNTVTLTGSGSDSDGSISTYQWTKVSGGAATLTGSTASTLNVSGLVGGTYVFRLTVKDNGGATATDDVTVLVNTPPVVSVGADIKITLPTNSVTVQGVVSDDGTIASYQWKMTTGTVATLSGTTTSKLTATGLIAGRYVFRLFAKDNYGASTFDDVLVTVLSATGASLDEAVLADNLSESRTLDSEPDWENDQYWKDKEVSLYDGTGKQLFTGKWTADRYYNLIKPGTLYIYNILDENRVMKKGKFIKVEL